MALLDVMNIMQCCNFLLVVDALLVALVTVGHWPVVSWTVITTRSWSGEGGGAGGTFTTGPV